MTKIGVGSRAFVVDPAIPCESMDTSGYVSKVYKDEEYFYDATDKPIILAKLKEADPEQKYFLYPVFCKKVGNLTEQNIKDGVKEKNKYLSYLVKKGGNITLNDFVEQNMNSNMTNEEVIDFLTGPLRTVFEAIELLHSKNLLHNDLHLQNILMTDDGRAQIIDFDAATVGFADPQEMHEAKDNELQGVIEDIVSILKDKWNLHNDPDLKEIIDGVYQKLKLNKEGGRRRRKTRVRKTRR